MKLRLFDAPKCWIGSIKKLYRNAIAEVAQEKVEGSDFADAHFIDKAFTWATAESYTLFNPKAAKYFAEQKYTHEIYSPIEAAEFLDKKFKAEGIDIIGRKAFNEIYGISMTEADRVFKNMKKEVSAFIDGAIKEGMSKAQAVEVLQQYGLSESYSDMVYQTTTNTAINGAIYNGSIKSNGLIQGFRFIAVMDERTRTTHAAANGLEQYIDSGYWDYLFPPLGYNCRCNVLPIRKIKKYSPPLIHMARPDYDYFGKRPPVIYK